MTNKTPNPGSPEAVSQGCTCPRLDNGNGRGYLCDNGERFVIAGFCPLHGKDRDDGDQEFKAV